MFDKSVLMALASMSAFCTASHAAVITASSTTLSNVTVDLTAEGTTDWAKFRTAGFVPGAVDFQSKTPVLISPSSAAQNAVALGDVTYTWSDGNEAVSGPASGSTDFYLTSTNGFTFTVELPTTQQYRLDVYAGFFSGPAITQTVTGTVGSQSASAAVSVADANSNFRIGKYTFLITPDSANQVATITLANAPGTEPVYLGAATLSLVPEPGSMLLMGAAGAVLMLRRRVSM